MTSENPRILIERKVVVAALNAATKAHDVTSIAAVCFDDLETLFRAIATAADAGEHLQATKLAKIGAYLASDWANLAGCENEQLGGGIDTLRAVLGLPRIDADGGAK